jgi:tryptophan synthase alpha chain
MTISETLTRCKSRGTSALIPYLTAGYPNAGESLALMKGMVSAGADIIELGVPFSDPLADGPTIQRASFQALAGGMSVRGVLDLLRSFRADHDTPVVLFSYLNPLLRYGLEGFLKDAEEAGAQGLLLTDLPTGADPAMEGMITESGLDLIRLLAPTTTKARMGEVATGGGGFVYYISRTGVTGAQQELREGLGREVEDIRAEVGLPIVVGFGISTPEQAASVAGLADGVVVGSALINALDEGGVDGALAFLKGLREGMDRAL